MLFNPPIFEEKVVRKMFFCGMCSKRQIYCAGNMKARMSFKTFDNGNKNLWYFMLPRKKLRNWSATLVPLEKFFFPHNFGKRLKTTFCQIVEPKLVSKTANLLRRKYESKKVSQKFWRWQQKLMILYVTRKKRQCPIFAQSLGFWLWS